MLTALHTVFHQSVRLYYTKRLKTEVTMERYTA